MKKVCSLDDFINVVQVNVERTRSILSKRYNVRINGDHPFYRGLCDEACDILADLMIQSVEDKSLYLENASLTIESIDGEQKHTPVIDTSNWNVKHSWLKLSIDGLPPVYADPTCSQFFNLYQDIRPYHVSTRPPKWFYPDTRNPYYMLPNFGIGGTLRKTVKFLQYGVWGRVSECIHVVLGFADLVEY